MKEISINIPYACSCVLNLKITFLWLTRKVQCHNKVFKVKTQTINYSTKKYWTEVTIDCNDVFDDRGSTFAVRGITRWDITVVTDVHKVVIDYSVSWYAPGPQKLHSKWKDPLIKARITKNMSLKRGVQAWQC